jgi:hypothetical protein
VLPLVALSLAPTFASAQDCAVTADVLAISVSAGGVQTLSIDVGPENALSQYFVLGSFSGTAPGFDLGLHYPLNEDRYLLQTWVGASRLVEDGGIGLTDSRGLAEIHVVVPPSATSALVGRTVNHAVAPISFLTLLHTCVSNPVPLTFTP